MYALNVERSSIEKYERESEFELCSSFAIDAEQIHSRSKQT